MCYVFLAIENKCGHASSAVSSGPLSSCCCCCCPHLKRRSASAHAVLLPLVTGIIAREEGVLFFQKKKSNGKKNGPKHIIQTIFPKTNSKSLARKQPAGIKSRKGNQKENEKEKKRRADKKREDRRTKVAQCERDSTESWGLSLLLVTPCGETSKEHWNQKRNQTQ